MARDSLAVHPPHALRQLAVLQVAKDRAVVHVHRAHGQDGDARVAVVHPDLPTSGRAGEQVRARARAATAAGRSARARCNS